MYWVGIDIGGTFTDAVVYDDSTGAIRSTKTPTTPAEPSEGVMDAIAALGIALGETSRFRHGATVATNATLERKGAEVAVVTTKGFRDVLIVGRGNRTDLYDIKAVRPPGLLKRSSVHEVPERIGANGEVLVTLDEKALGDIGKRLASGTAEAVAVCFLHAYANPSHEIRARELLAEYLDVPISLSSEVLAQHREYERFATTALNAYVAPRMSAYLGELRDKLADAGLRVAPEILSSSGGSWSFERMARLPVNSMLSGPAAGVIGAVHHSQALGLADFITYDMGGTSTDVALVRGGRYALAPEGDVGGLPNRVAQIEINTVGAGGGSIAFLDEGGFLNVGPRSAGALPGPAAYARGGTEPTVTDANVVLGRFRPEAKLGGQVDIQVPLAEGAISGLAKSLGLSLHEMAEGIVRIAVARMTGAIKEISIMRGIDPRELTLFSYGGAGPLHAALVARELGMKRVVVPAYPGAFSALGLLMAEPRVDVSRTQLTALAETTLAQVRESFAPLEAQAAAPLQAQGFAREDIRFEYTLDMRFVGQAFELTTPFDPDAESLEALVRTFLSVYEERYTHVDDGEVEIVSYRVAAHGRSDPPALPRLSTDAVVPEPISWREAYFDGAVASTPVYEREGLGVGARLSGPAVIEEPGATTLVPGGASCECLADGTLLIEVGEAV